jgi:ribosomal protein L37AE/L43A
MRRIAILSAVMIAAAFSASAQVPNGTLLTCESINNVRHTCRINVANGIMLNRQISKDACVRGKTWGTTRNNDGVWVDAGCRAEFLVGNGAAPLTGTAQTLICESIPNHTKRCAAPTANGVQMTRQISKHSCVLNRDWGWDNNGIWVKNGCRAEFTIGSMMTPMSSSAFPMITCESAKGMNHRCVANTMNGVTLSRQLSDAGCVQGQTWGYDANGIWVSNGCRAEFTLGH